MDYAKEIAQLREKINQDQNRLDFEKGELYYREVCNELTLKKNQVLQFKKDLQTANTKIFELNRELEISNSLLKESEFSLKLTLKKSSSLEEKLKEVNEAFTNLKLKEELKLSEIQILNDNIQKIAQQNHQLSREVEEFQEKLKYSCIFQSELDERQMKVNSTIATTKENAEKLEQEQLQIMELEKTLQSCEKFQNLSQSLAKENERLKEENSKLENALIESDAKYQKLYKLIKQQKVINMHQEDIISKIKYLQWESHYKQLQERNFNNEQIISTLTVTLNKEIETNTHLIMQNEEYEARIEELEKRINVKVVKEEEIDVVEIE